MLNIRLLLVSKSYPLPAFFMNCVDIPGGGGRGKGVNYQGKCNLSSVFEGGINFSLQITVVLQ